MSYDRKQPWVVEEKAGRKAWCACGESANKPYCDGSHARKNTGKTPIVVQLEEDKKVAWCGCGRSGNKPFCDGTHAKL